jgi:hypothetical protein
MNKVWVIVCFIHSWGYEAQYSINMSTFLSTLEIRTYFELTLQANQSFNGEIFSLRGVNVCLKPPLRRECDTTYHLDETWNYPTSSHLALMRGNDTGLMERDERCIISTSYDTWDAAEASDCPNTKRIRKCVLRDRIFETIVNAQRYIFQETHSPRVQSRSRGKNPYIFWDT